MQDALLQVVRLKGFDTESYGEDTAEVAHLCKSEAAPKLRKIIFL
jgi:hypothetical protein